MKIARLDFETFSEKDIKFGSFRYAKDLSTEVICMAYRIEDGPYKLWKHGDEPPKDFVEHLKSGGLIKGWNTTFEYAILKYTCQRLYGWGDLKPEQVLCTQADAHALALPSNLENCAIALGSSQLKDKRGKQLIQQLSKPRKATKNKPYIRVTPEIDPEAFQEFYDYCIQDVKAEEAIDNMLPRHIKDKELDLFRLTIKINERGLPVDLPLVNCILREKEVYERRLNDEVRAITDGSLLSTSSRDKSLAWLAKNGLTLVGYTKGDIKKALKREDLKPEVRRFLEIRSELSRTPIKKFDFIKGAVCADNTIKNNIIFHKATTGRYAGSGFQVQNLPRDSHENPEELIEKFLLGDLENENIYNEAIKLIRSVITAKDGFKLVVSDFSSIENRDIAWLAEDFQTLQDFIDGLDQYKTAASDIYNVHYDDVTKDQRQLGKIAVLSCGFGGGWKTFKKVCEESWGIKISEDEAQFIVEGYRKKYYKIVKLWYGLYEEALNAVITGRVTIYKSIKFKVIGDFLYMRLPSGRKLAYYKPKTEMVTTPWGQKKLALTHMGTNTYTKKWERLVVIPGRLTENAVQAIARDNLTDAMLKVEAEGYEIVACVHDEIIAHVPEFKGSIDHFNTIMSERPEWAPDLPIECEGFEGKRYRK